MLPPTSGSSSDTPTRASLLAQKLDVLRLLRALDRVGVTPAEHAGLPGALARLHMFDEMLTTLLVFADDGAEGTDDPEFVASAETFVETGPAAREEVLAVLPPEIRMRAAGAATQAVATEAEVMLELEARRREAETYVSDDEDEDYDVEDMFREVDRAAEALASFDAAPLPHDERVARQEAKPLPLARAPEPWLERLPAAWLKTMARLHGLDSARKKPVLVKDIAKHLRTPEALRPVLAEALDPEARLCLAGLLVFGEAAGEEFDEAFAAAAAVPWDWTSRTPAVLAPGRLRVYGLAFVGRRKGETVYALPEDLVVPVAEALFPLLREAGPSVPEDVLHAMEALASGRPREVVIAFDSIEEGEASAASDALLERPGNETILELEVILRVDRDVRRRLLVSSRRSLGSLHTVLQHALGWEDYHLHSFKSPSDGQVYGSPDFELDPFSTFEDEWSTAVGDVLPRVKSRLEYEYDFGDGWEHDIRCVARHAPDAVPAEPHCLGGRGACPPEDVGGRWGYAGYLEALADPEHPEHEHMVEWRGPNFDPDRFDLDDVNARLAAQYRTG